MSRNKLTNEDLARFADILIEISQNEPESVPDLLSNFIQKFNPTEEEMRSILDRDHQQTLQHAMAEAKQKNAVDTKRMIIDFERAVMSGAVKDSFENIQKVVQSLQQQVGIEPTGVSDALKQHMGFGAQAQENPGVIITGRDGKIFITNRPEEIQSAIDQGGKVTGPGNTTTSDALRMARSRLGEGHIDQKVDDLEQQIIQRGGAVGPQQSPAGPGLNTETERLNAERGMREAVPAQAEVLQGVGTPVEDATQVARRGLNDGMQINKVPTQWKENPSDDIQWGQGEVAIPDTPHGMHGNHEEFLVPPAPKDRWNTGGLRNSDILNALRNPKEGSLAHRLYGKR